MKDTDRRYLRLLQIDGRPSGLAGLRELVRQHLCRVPFENVSKLLLFERERAGRPVRLEEFLDGIEHQDLGGTCYSCNPFLADLLRALGYDAALLGADMSEPDVHTAIAVRVDGRDYHIDVGYAAPFYEPIPFDDLPATVPSGEHRYVFERGPSAGSCRLTMYVAGEPRHGYVSHPPARSPEFFHPTILKSFEPQRTFMNVFRITRFFADRTVEFRNTRLLRHTRAATSVSVLSSMSELREALEAEFEMPRCPVEPAIRALEELTGRPFFSTTPWADVL